METIGVIGAGVMGVGVAQDVAQHGRQVILVDVDDARLARARQEIRGNLRMQGLFRKPQAAAGPQAPQHSAAAASGESSAQVLARITFTTDYARLAAADFVVENVIEKWPVKERVYRLLDAHCPPACVFGANTSAISITRIGSATGRPDRVVGMHFMNPVPQKSMVEVIRGFHTSEAALARALELLALLGKEGIVVNDMPGFVTNRVLMLTINEAIFVVQDGVAPHEDVDRIFKTCFGHKMGPLETGDLIGLDTILYSLEVLYESYNDDKYRPCPLLRKMVDAGLHGRKSGRGFYTYETAD
ncbi:MAG: 3-hydroxybutyryl-CoA dehydrogenase [Acidobacteria bacterium]|nr:3-hydroxybutyryl-CoA dehydrogenase [Acidobacteriota bacterium]